LIIKEALNNIIKYSEAKNAYLTMSKIGNEISLQISDDGKGLDLELVKYGNGLKNIQKRCANIGATCEMKSAPGKGFAIEIQIPVEE
jgi:signal transduction histidine kinase